MRPGHPINGRFELLAFAAAVVLGGLSIAGLASASADDPFGRLMKLFAERPHGHAAFVETQFMSLLKQPLESSGELFFDAPDHLEKRTLLPRPESLVIDNGILTIRHGSRKYTVTLRAYPQVAPLIDSIRATLAGDRGALETVYSVRFDGGEHGWQLNLVPRDRTLAQMIKSIRISGAGEVIRTVETTRTDGDRSVMTVTVLPNP